MLESEPKNIRAGESKRVLMVVLVCRSVRYVYMGASHSIKHQIAQLCSYRTGGSYCYHLYKSTCLSSANWGRV